MSLNKYDATTGTLTTLANGQRIWLGTKAAHDAAAAAGTLPTNCLIAITDDGDNSGIVDVIQDGNMNPVTSNAVYDIINNIDEADYQEIQLPSNWWNNSTSPVKILIVRHGQIKVVYRTGGGLKMPYANNQDLGTLFPVGTIKESLRPIRAAAFYWQNLNTWTETTYKSLQSILITISPNGSIGGYCYNNNGVQSAVNDGTSPSHIYV